MIKRYKFLRYKFLRKGSWIGRKQGADRLGWIAIASFVVWILSIVAFLGESSLFLSSAGPEGGVYPPQQIMAMVGTVGIGVLSFLAFCTSLFIKLWLRSKAWALFATVLVVSVPIELLIFLAGVKIGENQHKNFTSAPTFTGQEIFDAVNDYRVQNGVKELKLDPNLCANLAQRYFDIRAGLEEGIAHKNFGEWFEKYVEPLGGYHVGENYAWGNTPQEVIKEWAGSPGHRLSILSPQSTLGCSYAYGGHAIIVLGYRQNHTSVVP